MQADVVHVIEGGGEGDGSFDVRRAGFVFERELVVSGFFKRHLLDHLAAAAPRRKRVEDFRTAPEDADAGGRVDLVAGEGEEIGTQGLDVDGQMGGGLGGIDHDERAGLFRGGGHFGDRVDGAEGVGNPGEGEDFGALAEERGEGVLIKRAVVVAGNHLEGRAGPLAEHLPRDDVRVVFQGGNEDFVAFSDAAGETEDVGDEVDAVGGAGGEDDLVRGGGVELVGDGLPGIFKGLGGEAGEVVGAAVDV